MSSLPRVCVALLISLSALPAHVRSTPTAGQQQNRTSVQQPLSARQVAQKVLPSVVYIEIEQSESSPGCYGSGFFVSRTQLLTNKHIVTCSGAGRGRVNLVGNKRSYPTTKILAWPDLDLALVEAEGLTAPPLQLRTDGEIRVGDDVFVAGNPAELEGTFTRGIVSGVRTREGLLQIDAPVSRGNSGGPVVDTYGRVVGITISSITEGQNLNFAIPAATLVGPLGRMRQFMAQQNGVRAKSLGTGSTTSPPSSSALLSTSLSPARLAWEKSSDWAAFVSSVVGDSNVPNELKALLDTGLSVNAIDKHGYTALHLAAILGQAELARYLLARGANINVRDRQGRTPLMLVVSPGDIGESADYSPWEQLWTDVPCAGKITDSPFPASTDEQLSWYLRVQAQAPVLRLLRTAGADMSLKDKDGLTALDYAVAGGPDTFDRLLPSEGQAQETTAVCHLTLEQAPALRVFRLGMSLRDVLTHFRRFELPLTDPLPRRDWLYWFDQIKSGPVLPRRPSFGDYTIQHPIYSEPIKGGNPSASIRYTAENYWVIMRGEGLRNEGGPCFAQYWANASLLSGRAEFRCPGFSRGDEYIYKIGQQTKKTGNPQKWLLAGINHHLTLVPWQIANAFGSSTDGVSGNGSGPGLLPPQASRKLSPGASGARLQPYQVPLIK